MEVNLASMPNFSPVGAGMGSENSKLYKIYEYKHPTGSYPFCDFCETVKDSWQFDSVLMF